jgi:hypothetical protein
MEEPLLGEAGLRRELEELRRENARLLKPPAHQQPGGRAGAVDAVSVLRPLARGMRAELDSWQTRAHAAWIFGSAARGVPLAGKDARSLLRKERR